MRHVSNQNRRSKKGFTLAELLIVVAIIAILVAIMVPVFGTSRANAVHAKDLSNVRSAYSEAVTTALAENNYESGKLKVVLKVDHEESPATDEGAETPHASTTVDTTSTVKLDSNSLVVTTTNAKPESTPIVVDSDVTLVLQGSATGSEKA